MAEVALGAGLQVLFGKVLDSLCRYRYRGNKYRLEELKITLERFQEMHKNDGEKVFRNEATRKWYHRVSCAVNDADGIMEDAEDADHKQRVCHPFPTLFKFDGKLGERITSVLKKLNGLEVEKRKLSFEEIDLTLNRETVSVSSKQVFGRNGEKEEIIDALLNDANTQNSDPHIYAIIGMGGIGKTTLAQLIYNDTRMVENFEHRIWVWVSQNFDVKLVMEKIIESHSKKTRKFESLEATQSCLKELLMKKKFLLVLDDIWNENQDEWNKLKSSLNFGAPGSSILLTTRGSDVASTARAHDQHKIMLLSEDQCWQVIKESAFLEENEENGQLEVIGKQIAKKCGGLPLAAKSLGGSLRLTREVYEWESVRDSPIWELPQPCEILPALKLSLDNLKSYSRDCFTFCCVFPKGYKMEKEELIQLWMANDLIPNLRLGLEDMGNKIFNDLLLKSFFQVSLPYYNYVTMHDLMHDLGLSFRTECFCLLGPYVSKIPTQCQHLFIEPTHPSTTNILQTLSKSHSSLRTLLIPFSSNNDHNKIIFKNLDCSSFFSNLQCLRALDLSAIEIEDLPKSIGKIKDLKYLNLDVQERLTHVPDSIRALTKLQTLKLSHCKSLTRLPDGITQLVSLRHLDISNCVSLTCLPDEIAGLNNLRHLTLRSCNGLTHLPDGIGRLINLVHLDISHLNVNLTRFPNWLGKLVNLQRLGLDVFVVGPDNGQRITELRGLNCLGGSLTIRGLEHVRDAREAEGAFLKKKKNFYSLSLIWGDLHGSNSNSDEAESVLEALQPPQNFNENLVIRGYGGSVFASWMKLLENSIYIELRDCIKCEHLPPLGQLPLLQYLTIAGMNSLK